MWQMLKRSGAYQPDTQITDIANMYRILFPPLSYLLNECAKILKCRNYPKNGKAEVLNLVLTYIIAIIYIFTITKNRQYLLYKGGDPQVLTT